MSEKISLDSSGYKYKLPIIPSSIERTINPSFQSLGISKKDFCKRISINLSSCEVGFLFNFMASSYINIPFSQLKRYILFRLEEQIFASIKIPAKIEALSRV